ncbi:MAG TPA: MFS transporter [Gaiellaceae bacterium]|jgi:predicted MFS family arabinose efflux permease
MRRLLLLVSALVAVDTMLFAALTPLLPHFASSLHLSKTGAGVLVGAYAAGALVGGLPGGAAAARLGSRRAVLVGLTLMGLSSLAFAFAHGYWALCGARFLQGCGSGFTWAVFGALFGPVVGALAALVGRAPVFVALAGLAVVLGVWSFRIEPAPPEHPSAAAMSRALRNSVFLGGLALMCLPALLFGVLSTLAPLHLSAAGWGAAAIGAVWLVGAALETVISPATGRVLDRRGARLPVEFSLAAGTLLSIGLAIGPRPLLYVPLVVLSAGAFGILFTPAFALLADGAEQSRLPQGMAFGLMNAAWAMGALLGPAAGGAIAAASGDVVPFLIAAALCAGGFVVVRWRAPAAIAEP